METLVSNYFTPEHLHSLSRSALQQLAKQCGVKANGKSADIVQSILELLGQEAPNPPAEETRAATDEPADQPAQELQLEAREETVLRQPQKGSVSEEAAEQTAPSERKPFPGTAEQRRDMTDSQPRQADTLPSLPDAEISSPLHVQSARPGRSVHTPSKSPLADEPEGARPSDNTPPPAKQAEVLRPKHQPLTLPDSNLNEEGRGNDVDSLAQISPQIAAATICTEAPQAETEQPDDTVAHNEQANLQGGPHPSSQGDPLVSSSAQAASTQQPPIPPSLAMTPDIQPDADRDQPFSEAVTPPTNQNGLATASIPEVACASAWMDNPMFDSGRKTESRREAVQQGLVSNPNSPVPPAAKSLAEARQSRNSDVGMAYERGRKSGVWHGRTEQQMQQLEESWDGYKACSVRGWSIPTLSDVQAKSRSLAACGFSTIEPPSPSSRPPASPPRAAQSPSGGRDLKRKAGAGAAAELDASHGSAAKRQRWTVPRTPSRFRPQEKTAPLQEAHANKAQAHSHRPSQIPCPPSHAGARAPAHVDRARKAAEAFTARRAAAIAKNAQKQDK